jgi:hypothetical protein
MRIYYKDGCVRHSAAFENPGKLKIVYSRVRTLYADIWFTAERYGEWHDVPILKRSPLGFKRGRDDDEGPMRPNPDEEVREYDEMLE